MTEHYEDFPYDPIEKEFGDFQFHSMSEAMLAGFDENQIWSVAIDESNTATYGPANHRVNLDYWVVTNERHDNSTYYIEV
tara:strand:+ start:412 stop:651 length:240 start_codon:yes stop_codon:yes gene_type:complete